jgi:peptidoglycan/LPS O-acetylase OafA/YrhL
MSVFPAIAMFAIVLMWAWILSKRFGAPSTNGRFASLDGLRGYLAFGVFIYHGSIWYYFVRSGKWDVPPSHVYTNLGEASVMLFFMITGFLFCSKLLRGRSERIDWHKLYVSRFLRLVPVYLLAVALMVLTICIITSFQLREPVSTFSKSILTWSSFSFTGIPNINRFEKTFIVIAGVTWTLRYEWLFYFTLPLLAGLVGVVTPRRFMICSFAIVAWMCYQLRPEIIYLVAFVGGITAACLVHFDLIRNLSRGLAGSILAAVAILAAVLCFPTAYQLQPLALLSIGFAIIAGGNTLFGALAWPASRFLGQLTYSIYLLHGIILFWVFRFAIGFRNAAYYSLFEHWLLISLCIPLVLTVCYITFRFIELPAMRSVSKVRTWFRSSPDEVKRAIGSIAPT